MEEFYSQNRMNVMSGSSENGNQVENDPRITGTTSHTGGGNGGSGFHGGPIVLNDANINILQFETDQGMAELLKTQIANHPHYPDLVAAYIGCQKVGAPPEMKNLLDEIARLSLPANPCRSEIGADPQLDQFMDAYCEVLHIFKEELSKVVEEATTFLSNIETKLSNLCRDTFQKTNWDYNSAEEAIGSSEEDFSYGEVEVAESQETSGFRGSDKELKDMLLHKYSGYLGKLKKDFLKTRKKGKLPKDARSALLDWWNTHFRWPYPTEEEKLQLSVVTGLDQRQINNWFINQRKRHWKPSEDMQFALMENVRGSSNGGEASGLPFDTGFGNEDFM